MTALFPVKGIRTSCITGEEQVVDLEFKIEDDIFQLIGGVTGYESFNIDSNFSYLEKMFKTGWVACFGTPCKWDKLVIPGRQMKKAFSLYPEALKCRK